MLCITQHGCRQKICMMATQTWKGSEHDTERGNSEQTKQNEELVPKRGENSAALMRFGYEKFETDQKINKIMQRYFANYAVVPRHH